MSRFYKLFGKFRTVFCILCVVLAPAFSGALAAQGSNDAVFTVPGVKVDVTADSALAAREEAFAQAQTLAFQQLAERLMPENQLAMFVPPDPSVISPMIKDFEITDEQITHVRYIATYTFRFNNDAVRGYLGSAGVAYTDVSSKPVLILPYYQWGAKTVIWGNENPWLAAWNSSKAARGLVPVIVPIGDLQDVSEMGDDDALTYNPQKLASMIQRYSAGEAIILLAVPEWDSSAGRANGAPPDRLVIMIYRTDRGQAEYANKLTVTKEVMGDAENIYAAAVKLSRTTFQRAWKNQTVVRDEQNSRLKVRVQFATLQEWAETQKSLRRVQGVSDMKLLSLTQNEAYVELAFKGTEQRLKLALAQADMTLAGPDGMYGAANAPPPVHDLYLNKFRR